MPLMERVYTSIIEIHKPSIVAELESSIRKLSPQDACYFICKKGKKEVKGILAGGVIEGTEGREDSKILIARLNGWNGLTGDQMLVEWTWNTMAQRYESAVSLIDIRRDPWYPWTFKLSPQNKEPIIRPNKLSEFSSSVTKIDFDIWWNVVVSMVHSKDAEKVLERWFGTEVARFEQ